MEDIKLSGKRVLVQTQAGIFYGTLDKMDMQAGTAFLRDGYMLPDNGYVTTCDAEFLKEETMDWHMILR